LLRKKQDTIYFADKIKKINMLLLPVLAAVYLHNMPVYGADQAQREFFAMDTVMSVTVNGEGAEAACDAAVSEVNRLDELLSTGKDSSEVSKINMAGGGTLSEDGQKLLKKALELYEVSDGLFDVSIYPVMELWGFTSGDYHVPAEDELGEALSLVDASCIDFDEGTGEVSFEKEGMKIDFGGIAKGYTSSRMIDILRERGITSALVNLGGNVQALGAKPDGSRWRVGVQDPEKKGGLLGVLSIADLAVITSGGYERFFEENGQTYHHIIDTRTGFPADSGLLSVTIVTEDGMLADGLSTFLFAAGADRAVEFWREQKEDFEMILCTADGSLLVTEGLGDIFTSDRDFKLIPFTE